MAELARFVRRHYRAAERGGTPVGWAVVGVVLCGIALAQGVVWIAEGYRVVGIAVTSLVAVKVLLHVTRRCPHDERVTPTSPGIDTEPNTSGTARGWRPTAS